jgi:GntR family transcriptional regulator/MocR family aminotransferase
VVVRAIIRLYLKAPKRSGLLLGFSGYPRQVIIPAVAHLAQVVGKQRPQSRRALLAAT